MENEELEFINNVCKLPANTEDRELYFKVTQTKALEQIAKELHTLNKNIELLCKYVKKTK